MMRWRAELSWCEELSGLDENNRYIDAGLGLFLTVVPRSLDLTVVERMKFRKLNPDSKEKSNEA